MSIYAVTGGELQNCYAVGGTQLAQAYDISGNKLLSSPSWVSDLPDSGYSFTDGSNTYATKLMFNFGTTSFQSVVRNRSSGVLYRASTDAKVYPYDNSLTAMPVITLPSVGGHKNDGCYYNGNIYWLDGTADAPAAMFVWNPAENTVSSVTLPVRDNVNGSKRVVAGICNASASGTMYLVSRDQYNNSDIDHQEGDVMCVYEYDVASNTVSLVASFPWDCVYVQGATYINGLLYVACNTQTTGSASNYTGITIKVIDPTTWTIVKTLTCSGNFEPQGCDSITADGNHYIWTGVSKYGTLDKVVLLNVA